MTKKIRMIKRSSLLSKLWESPFGLSRKYAAWCARQHRCTLYPCESIYRQTPYSAPHRSECVTLARCTLLSRDDRLSSASLARLPSAGECRYAIYLHSSPTRAHSLRRERSFCMSLVRLLSRIPGRRRAKTPVNPVIVRNGN